MPKATAPRLSIPASSEHSLVMEKFKGVDLTSSPVNVAFNRSPEAPNMMPDNDGFPVKRKGWQTVAGLDGTVWAHHTLELDGVKKQLLHVGTTLYGYTDDIAARTALYADMADGPSCAAQIGGKLWLLDGKTYLVYDGETVRPVSEIATVPKITISKEPDGESGATSYQPVNLLTGRRTDSFLGKANVKEYFLSFDSLTSEAVEARVLDGSGSWNTIAEGSGLTVDRALGKVTFATAPGASPVTGQDNVEIEYSCESRAAEINGCRFCILYGVSGAMDRIFMSGNPQEKNVDWWTEYNDPAYVGDVFYAALGQEASAITGYTVLGNMLVTHKRDEENQRNAFIRKGEVDEDGYGLFTLENVIQGEGCLGWRSCGSIGGEPVFLTAGGVTALTTSDVTGERYSQNRSYYINGALKKAEGLESACSCVWGQFYCLSVGERLYLIDSTQKSFEARSPYSTRQYECYYFTNIRATALWTEDDRLCFGTADGKVRRLRTGETGADYYDDDRAVKARWDTPLMNLENWSRLKSVVNIWVVLQPYARSGADVYFTTDKKVDVPARSLGVDIFSFDEIDFDRFTFNAMTGPAVSSLRKRARKIKLIRLSIRNERPGEPMGLYAVHLNFKEGSKVKR